MNLIKRLLFYTIMLLLNCGSTILLVESNIFKRYLIEEIIIVHVFINIIFFKYFLRFSTKYNIIISSLISTITLFIALLISELEIISYKIDAFGVYTAIVTKGIFTVLFMEVVYQIKNRRS